MTRNNEQFSQLFHIGEQLFRHAFWLYHPLYAIYKMISDRHERRLLQSCLRPGMTVVDIGANIGIYTAFFSVQVGSTGKVYAFEPSPIHFKHLVKTRRHNIIPIQAAVGNVTGKLPLYIANDLNVDNTLYDVGEDRDQVIVDCYRLDDYFAGSGQTIDVIKIDIQGFEYQALLGMKAILQTNPAIKLLIEYWPYRLKQAGDSAQKLFDFLQELGFQIELLENGTRQPYSPISSQEGYTYYRNLFLYRTS